MEGRQKKHPPTNAARGGIFHAVPPAMIGYTFKYLWIYLSWGDIYKIFTDATQTLSDYIDSVYTLDDAIAVRSEE